MLSFMIMYFTFLISLSLLSFLSFFKPLLLLLMFIFLLSNPFFIFGNLKLNFMNMSMDWLNFSLMTLTILIFIFMLLNSLNMANKMFFFKILWVMMMILMMSFSVINILMFYMMFELTLIPIFLMILGWGYQPERYSASLNLILYTIFASLPFFLILIYYLMNYFIYNFCILELTFNLMFSQKSSLNFNIMYLFLNLGFLVKFPMFLVHLWLPKAHVEAPVSGSMILAAILLKLGGYGLLRMTKLFNSQDFLIQTILFLSIIGGALISILCINQVDMKVLIAYSSISHMSLVIATFLSKSKLGLTGGFLMMLAHGVVSSGMFSGANILYMRSQSRNILLNLNNLNLIPMFSFWWFFLCLGNMGAPPTLNLIAEICSMILLFNMSMFNIFSIILLAFFAVVYSLILYSGTQQGISKFNSYYKKLNMSEILMLYMHVYFSIVIILNLDLLI